MRLIRSLVSAVVLVMPAAANAQSLLERPPNVSGDWTGAPGTIYFHFLHRFSVSQKPERKVSNVPTFLLAAGLPKHFLAGFHYSTNSTLAPRFPNEWELFARWSPLGQDYGAPIDLGGQIGYNNAADGIDGEVSIARKLGITRLIVAGRALADPFEDGNTRFALAGGAAIRLGQYVALAGDVASLMDKDSSENVAWSAGLHLAIPLTPHTVSLQVTNTLITTLQGASRGTDDVRYGFEFTIPLTLRRYFGKREQPVAAAEPPPDSVQVEARDTMTAPARVDSATAPVVAPPRAPVVQPPAAARPDTSRAPAPAARPATIPAPRPAARTSNMGIKNLNYLKPKLEIAVGTTVVWTNNDAVPHTVTASDRSFDSGLIQPGKTYRRTFTRAGTYNYFCTPHPFMKATVVVK